MSEAGDWIKWEGGECPVAQDTILDVKHRDGEIFRGQPAMSFRTHRGGEFIGAACTWQHDGECGDIIAYRVVSA